MIHSRHTLSHCNLCERDMVLCASCGNNCCNGGSGVSTGEDGRPIVVSCPDTCSEAYAHQDAYAKDHTSVVFAKDTRNLGERVR